MESVCNSVCVYWRAQNVEGGEGENMCEVCIGSVCVVCTHFHLFEPEAKTRVMCVCVCVCVCV